MDKTDIILRNLTEAEILSGKPFSHFGWEGNGAFSFISISDGYWESAKILLEKMKEESNSIAIVDTLIYPLFFNYRHSIEAYLKALYFSYGEQTDEARKKILKLGHNLQKLWEELRPIMDKGVNHVGSYVNLDAVEHYIKSINEFDPDSMVMRYPINKKLEINKAPDSRFDFVNLGERMNELCDSLRQLDDDISNQMTEMASLEELSNYLDIFKKYQEHIDIFLSLLKNEVENETKDLVVSNTENFLRILNEKKILPSQKFLSECEPDLLILLDNLYYAGRSVNEHVVRLAISPNDRQKGFVRLCNELLEKDKLSFGKIPEDWQINIREKTASALVAGLSTAVSILTLA